MKTEGYFVGCTTEVDRFGHLGVSQARSELAPSFLPKDLLAL